MERIFFILNPVAGGGSARDLRPEIKNTMKDFNIDYRIELTKGPKHATDLTKEAVEEGYDTVVAVGGDGTVNEVALGLLDTDVALGLVPGGTGNDYARTLDIPLDIDKAIREILENQARSVDIGFVNGKLFLNIASIGLDAAVVKGAEKYKEKYQSATAYGISLLENLLSFRKKKMILDIDGEIIDEEMYLVAVGNGQTYGGGFKIMPMAKVDDGDFYICTIGKAAKPVILFLFPSILFGKHTLFKKYVNIYRAKKVKVYTKEDLYLNIDGEIYDVPEETVFELASSRLKIRY